MALQNFQLLSILRQNCSLCLKLSTATNGCRFASSDPASACRKASQSATQDKKKGKKDTKKPEPDPCDYKVCNRKKKRKSLWRRLFEPPLAETMPPVECCRLRHHLKCDPDLSEFGGEVYKTCGSAYIIQKDRLPTEESETSKEDLILRRMEACLDFKDVVNEDPLPAFKSAESRMLEMADRKLHPAYRTHCHVKKKHIQAHKRRLYKTVSWPIDMHEIPARLNINKDILERKNMEYMEFKRIEPPRQLINRIVEMEKNARPTLEKRCRPAGEEVAEEQPQQQQQQSELEKGTVFDTLQQHGTKF